jgi:hypothetical protein
MVHSPKNLISINLRRGRDILYLYPYLIYIKLSKTNPRFYLIVKKFTIIIIIIFELRHPSSPDHLKYTALVLVLAI